MSTRAQIIVKDADSEQWFYRHSDGYPEGTMPTLEKFLGWIKDKRIRDNVEQSCGWLVLIGHQEYLEYAEGDGPFEPGHDINMSGWKAGAYEPCAPVRHGDIEYLYTIDLSKRTIMHEKV